MTRSYVTRLCGSAVVAVALALPIATAHAQRGGRRGGFGQYFGGGVGANDFYVPPDFHGNPPYDGRFTFARIEYRGGDHWSGREGPGWSHDYPDADEHLMRIMSEVTDMHPFVEKGPIVGGVIVALDNPLLFKYPVAYLSEPGGWHPNANEVDGLKKYLAKGGFIIFDDFSRYDMVNLVQIMQRAVPGGQWVHLDGTEPIFNTFFKIDVKLIAQQCMQDFRSCYRGIPQYWALYENNDPTKRIIALANVDADIGEFWQWSGQGFYPVAESNEAYKLGVNYMIYALTH
jgi:hypothetical protein